MSDTGIGGFIGMFLGGLIPAFLFSRVFLWLMQDRGGLLRGALIANTLSLATTIILAVLGYLATGEGFAFADVILRYLLPQLFWLGVDLTLAARKTPAHLRKSPAP